MKNTAKIILFYLLLIVLLIGTLAASDSKGRYVLSETGTSDSVAVSSTTATLIRAADLDRKHGTYKNYSAYRVHIDTHSGVTTSDYFIDASTGTHETWNYTGPIYGLSQPGGEGTIYFFEEQ